MTALFDRLQLIEGPELARRVSMLDAIRGLQQAIRDGFDPDDDPARTIVDVRSGQLLLMPADLGRFAGQKLGMVAPGNAERGLERIQAISIVLDAETLAPVALIDGTELTSIRTPAVSAAVVDCVADADARELVVFGTGPQGIRHVEAMRAIRPIERVTFVGRDHGRAEQAASAAAAFGVDARVGTADDARTADIIVCATTARIPLVDAEHIRDIATIVAVGSHEADARELPGDLLGRSQVIVETRRIGMSEAGDVVMAVAEGHLSEQDLVPMRDIITGDVDPVRDRPRIVKTCGMGWQDLAVGALAVQ